VNKRDHRRKAWAVRLACLATGTAVVTAIAVASAQADTPASGSSIPGAVQAPGASPLGTPNFAPPAVNPGDNETVGVAQPVMITFRDPIRDRAAAERAIQITSSTVVPGHFYWFGNKQVRWRPDQFWPAHTDVTVKAGGTTSKFHIGDAFVATADDATHQIVITRNGKVVKTMPVSMGEPGHETPNGTYFTGEKHDKMIMDSATYGVPSTAPGGYKLEVYWATRIANNGIFIHAAPWSVAQQGHTDVSHGCLNVSTANAKWYYDNVHKGDPVIVKNTKGGTLNGYDGYGDWNL
jgi:lipoprotein-anchoring transpeptidase ErfK/SrfK